MEIDSEHLMKTDREILSTREYDRLEPILQKINRDFIRIKSGVRRRNLDCFYKCKDDFIIRMKDVNPTFSKLFQEVRYTGSFYERSRVHEPNEFDINLVLQVPCAITIQDDDTSPGFVKLKVDERLQSTNQNRDQCEWVENGFISSQAVMQWFEGVISSVFEKARVPGMSIIVEDMYSVSVHTKNSPAMTLRMQNINAESRAEQIDVDFVPVFEFQYPEWWPQRTRPFPDSCYNMVKHNMVWSVTPKVESNPLEWRLSFSILETQMIKNKPNLKNAYRLLKRLRDGSVNLKHLNSYCIKTLFLWKVDQLDSCEWRKSLGRVFMMMLFELENCLYLHKIPFFWDRRKNMIKYLKPEHVYNMCMQLSTIRENINRLLDTNNMQELAWYLYTCMSN